MLSSYRRTKDALLYPSLYFERIRKESTHPALLYYLVTEAILFFVSYLPYGYFSSQTTSEFFLKILQFAPITLLGIFITTLLTHIAIIILNRGKTINETIKFIIYIAQPIRLFGVVCAYITFLVGYALIKSYAPETGITTISSLYFILPFIKTFAVALIIFITAYVLFAAYAAFRMLVGMHKLLSISLERAFWTNVISATLNILFAVGILIIANKIF